jgi:hypothetical protein
MRGVWGALAVLAVTLACASPASASPYLAPGISPPGANDWDCRPTAARPVPVVLVHGTFADMTVSWNLISPALKADQVVHLRRAGVRVVRPAAHWLRLPDQPERG